MAFILIPEKPRLKDEGELTSEGFRFFLRAKLLSGFSLCFCLFIFWCEGSIDMIDCISACSVSSFRCLVVNFLA